MIQLTMNPAGKWVQLHADGTMTTFLTEGSDEAEWTVSGENFTMTVAGKTVGTGTLAGGTLTLDLSGVEYTLTQEGTTPTGDSDPGRHPCHLQLLRRPLRRPLSHRALP